MSLAHHWLCIGTYLALGVPVLRLKGAQVNDVRDARGIPCHQLVRPIVYSTFPVTCFQPVGFLNGTIKDSPHYKSFYNLLYGRH